MNKEKPKLYFRFHNPNPEQGIGTILQVCIKANIRRVDELVAHELMKKPEMGEEENEVKIDEGGLDSF